MNELEATRAKLKCLEMVEGTRLKWWQVVKIRQMREDWKVCSTPIDLSDDRIGGYIFALGVVEGKPVWEGDYIFHERFGKVVARANGTKGYLKIENTDISHKGAEYLASSFSWSPPKPATLMVELPIDVVKYNAGLIPIPIPSKRLYEAKLADACRKALSEMK